MELSLIVLWGIFIFSFLYNRSRLRNCFYLMACIFNTITYIASLLDDAGSFMLVGLFVLMTIIIMMVPFLLIANGVVMLRRENFSVANILSLVFGIIILLGEIAFLSVIYMPYAIGTVKTIWDAFAGKKFIAIYGMSVFYISVVFVCFMFYSKFIEWVPHIRDFDFVIIHGAGLINGDQMSKLLKDRCDKAIEVYKKDKTKPKLIPSGGQGKDETISEAQAMAQYLIANGVDPNDIIIEDKSPDTLTNIANSKEIIDAHEGRKRIALVSSNYHVYRCLLDARNLGLKCTGIGAHVAYYYWPSALIREFIAVFSRPLYLITLIIFWLPILFVSVYY